MAAAVGHLEDTSSLLERPAERDAFLKEHGYLFLRGVLDQALGERLREQIVGEMKRQGAVRSDAISDDFMLTSRDAVDQGALYDQVDYMPFWKSSEPLFELLLGGPVYIFRNTVMRFAVPHEALYTTPPHQDGASVSSDFHTVWAPLMDVPIELGGLTVADGSHKGGLRATLSDPSQLSYTTKIPFGYIPLESIQEPWLSADFRLGDALIFHPWTIHRALPNRSRRVRLSVDTRFQSEAAPRDFVTHTQRGSDFTKHLDRYIAEMPAEQLGKNSVM